MNHTGNKKERIASETFNQGTALKSFRGALPPECFSKYFLKARPIGINPVF